MNRPYDAQEISTLSRLRQDIPLTRDFIYLNSCTFGPVLTSVQRCMADALRLENESIIAIRATQAGVNFYARAEQARESVADLLSVPREDVAWTLNTTMASRVAILSVDWKDGDRLAVTDGEHLSTRSVAQGLTKAKGVEVTVVPSGDGAGYTPDGFLERLDRHLTPAHRMLVVSHVSNIDGRLYPIREATRMANDRGVQVLVDGAQSFGVLATDLAAMGADFYTSSVHKWCMGPPRHWVPGHIYGREAALQPVCDPTCHGQPGIG